MLICTKKCILSYRSVNIIYNLLIIKEVITSSLIVIPGNANVIKVRKVSKVISGTSKMILATEEDTANLNVFAATTKIILAIEKK